MAPEAYLRSSTLGWGCLQLCQLLLCHSYH